MMVWLIAVLVVVGFIALVCLGHKYELEDRAAEAAAKGVALNKWGTLQYAFGGQTTTLRELASRTNCPECSEELCETDYANVLHDTKAPNFQYECRDCGLVQRWIVRGEED